MLPSSRSDDVVTPTAPRHRRLRNALTVLVMLAVLGGLGAWLTTNGPETLAAARAMTALPLIVALVAVTIGALVAAQAWRAALVGLGGDLPMRAALRVCLVGQLGKYLPGSLWPALVQAELAERRGVRRATVVAAFSVSLAASLSAGAVVGALALLDADDSGATAGGPWAVVLVGVCSVGFLAVLIQPQLLTRVVGGVLARVTGSEVAPMPSSAVRRCFGLSVVGWIITGLHVWVLAVALGADPVAALPAAISGLALATVAGSLFVLAPGGLGAREVVLVAVLAAVLPIPAAAAVAAASRLLTLFGECALALVTALADRPVDGRPRTLEGQSR